MTRNELIQEIKALDTDLTKTNISSTLNALADVIASAMAAGDEVTLPGIGKFVVKATAARNARNPKTGAVVAIPAGKKVAFKVSSTLKAVTK